MTEGTAYRLSEVRARTIRDFCRAYGIGRSMAYELIGQGRLRAVKAGTRTLIDEESAKVWFASTEQLKDTKAAQAEVEAVRKREKARAEKNKWQLQPEHVADTLPRGVSGIYIVAARKYVKIGWSENVPERILAIQSGLPERLTVLCTFPGSRKDEAALHLIFAKYRTRGEWFKTPPDLMIDVARYRNCPPKPTSLPPNEDPDCGEQRRTAVDADLA